MGLVLTIKSKRSFEKNELPEMGPGEIPEEAIPNGAQ